MTWAVRFAAMALCALTALGASADETKGEPLELADGVLANLSQHSVSLDTTFSGSELLVYGAIARRDVTTKLDVIVAVAGPSNPVTVRKKVRQFGIWINGKAVTVDAAPSFYALASTRPLDQVLNSTDDLRYRIRLDRKIRLIDAPAWLGDERSDYREAVSRVRINQGLYAILPDAVSVIEKEGSPLMQFETRIQLPANLVEGDYEARIFLVRGKQVVDTFTDKIEVRRAGLGRMIYTSAQDYPALYGIASILIALFAGWLASAFFRTFFPM